MGAPSSVQPPNLASSPPATTGSYRTLSAARVAAAPPPPQENFGQRARSFLEDLALNTAARGRELVADFQQSDRFFKYKVFILAGWLALSAASFGVACPGRSGDAGNRLGAKLVTTEVGSDAVYSLRNQSEDPWLDVRVVVNGVWQLASPRVEAGEALTFETRRLTGLNGDPAPKDLLITEMELKTEDGDTRVIANGMPRQ